MGCTGRSDKREALGTRIVMKPEITVQVKLFMSLKKYIPENVQEGNTYLKIEEGAMVKDLLARLGIPFEEDKIIVLNGISYKQSEETNSIVLQDGDVIAIFPPIAGG